jgi:hypothetical protein
LNMVVLPIFVIPIIPHFNAIPYLLVRGSMFEVRSLKFEVLESTNDIQFNGYLIVNYVNFRAKI